MRSLLKRILTAVGILIVISPCGYCWWIMFGQNAVFSATLVRYPNSRGISEGYTYFGAGTGMQTQYLWTPDTIDDVKQFYETFAVTMDNAAMNLDNDGHRYYRTVFNPFNQPVPVITNEFSRKTVDAEKDLACYYRLTHQCVEVALIEFSPLELVTLPDPPGPARQIRIPSPITSQLYGGTLIVYHYYLPVFPEVVRKRHTIPPSLRAPVPQSPPCVPALPTGGHAKASVKC
jgi:hypothetical protein